jgi:hypothetical protein
MLNNQVFQYSSYVVKRGDKIIKIIGILLTKNTYKTDLILKKSFKYIIKSIKNLKESQHSASKVISFIGNIIKIKFDVDLNVVDFEEVAVAIIKLSIYRIC